MNIRPYLTYQGDCEDAIHLYERAFSTKVRNVTRFSDLPPDPDNSLPDDLHNKILQARLPLGETYLQMSDCPDRLNDPESERISLAVEVDVETVQKAFAVLAEEGRVVIPLAKTFYSPLAGVVFDKFGVMWNFIGI